MLVAVFVVKAAVVLVVVSLFTRPPATPALAKFFTTHGPTDR